MQKITQWAIGLLFSVAAPVSAQNFEVRSGYSFLQRPGERFSLANPGVKLFQNDRITTGGDSKVDVWIDYKAGIVSLGNFSQLDLVQVTRRRGCSVQTIEFQGGLGAKIKPFTCPSSLLRIISQNNGAVYTFRGTEAHLSTTGDRSQVTVITGEVEARQQKGRVVVPTGKGAIIDGQEHPVLVDIDWLKKLETKTRGDRIKGQVNPLNKVQVNGSPVETNAHGQFTIKNKMRGNGTVIHVTDPLGNGRSHPR